MAANYSTNPTNPVNQSGGIMPGNGQADPNAMMQGQARNPRTIRDYVAAARSKAAMGPPGTEPQMSFTNQPGGQGFMVEDQPQAIPEGPQSDYEKVPFAQRMKMNPYIRAQSRINDFLPELWQQMFPGMENGAMLTDQQMKHWTGAVEQLTGNLLKQYDKQYEWSLKNEQSRKKERSEYQKFLHSKYLDLEGRGQAPTNPETGEVLSAQEYISKNMSIKDEMTFKDDMEAEDRGKASEGLNGLSSEDVGKVFKSNPDLGKSVKEEVLRGLSEKTGVMVSEEMFAAMRKDKTWSDIIDQLTWESVQNREQEIMQLLK